MRSGILSCIFSAHRPLKNQSRTPNDIQLCTLDKNLNINYLKILGNEKSRQML